MQFNRRQSLLAAGAAALAPGLFGRPAAAASAPHQGAAKKVLFFTKSSGFQHSVIQRKGNQLGLAERILTEIAKTRGYEVEASKDGRLFEPDKIGRWDAFVFVTTGDLTAKEDPTAVLAKEGKDAYAMSPEGKKALLDAIEGGKGFMGMHCATDTFHSQGGTVDPYIKMIGGEFAGHGAQMFSTLQVADPKFPGLADYRFDQFRLEDEWYNQTNIADDLHVITYHLTNTMKTDGGNKMYDRPNFPQTWTRKHGKGRVFYTSMGHREDVWENPFYQDLLVAALDFITGKVNPDTEPNIAKVTPDYKKMSNEQA